MLKECLTFATIRLAQDPLEKRSLSPYSFHDNPHQAMTTHALHSQSFIGYHHVYKRFFCARYVPHETQQGRSLVEKLSVHESHALSQQLHQRFPSPPHHTNETPQRRAFGHGYPSLTLDHVARVEDSLRRTTPRRFFHGFRCLLCHLFGFFRLSRLVRFRETFFQLLDLVDVRLFPGVKSGKDGWKTGSGWVASATTVSAARLDMLQ